MTTMTTQWHDVCELSQLRTGRGVAALLDGVAIAIFKVASEGGIYAVDHLDPRTVTPTIARGLIGSVADEPVVVSPLQKDRFSLTTGNCLNDAQLSLRIHDVRIANGQVQVRPNFMPGK